MHLRWEMQLYLEFARVKMLYIYPFFSIIEIIVIRSMKTIVGYSLDKSQNF